MFTGKVFISTPEDTGPAHTQMQIQQRLRALDLGPPFFGPQKRGEGWSNRLSYFYDFTRKWQVLLPCSLTHTTWS